MKPRGHRARHAPGDSLSLGPRLTGVYIHLPFCDIKCAYCDFYSLANRHVDDHFWETYLQRLERDLEQQYALLLEDTRRPVLASIFFGGGTPSKAPGFIFERLIAAVRAIFSHALLRLEITCEANPESLSDGVLADWQKVGVNRISVGMQSLDEQVLKYLGRLYNPHAYRQVLTKIRQSGFKNYSADFITGVPGQTLRSTLSDVEFALKAGVTHLSLYQLTIEPGTLLKQRIESGRLVPPADARQVRQMDSAISYLETQGFQRYEISNFAHSMARCRHNLIYWTQRPYLGLGVAAHAFTGRRRFFHPRSLEKYLAGGLPQEDTLVTQRDALINLLRLRQRLPQAKILALFETQKRTAVLAELAEAKNKGWLEGNDKVVAMTHAGLKHADSLLANLWNL